MRPVQLYVSVPLASFRVAQAREYWETYPCPPPSTVYGMLLSMVGEANRLVHAGAEVAVAVTGDPARSVILRTLWRVKSRKEPPGVGANKRPDFQEILSSVALGVWVRPGASEKSERALFDRVTEALHSPEDIRRYGGLSLGESTHLVDQVRKWDADDPANGRVLVSDPAGDLSLPIWADHVGSKNTRWGQYALRDSTIGPEPPEEAWTAILRPE